MEKSLSLKNKIKFAFRLDRSLRFVWQAAPIQTLLNMTLVTIQGLLPVLTLYLIKLIVDGTTLAINASDKFPAFKHVVILIAFTAGVAVLHSLFQQLSALIKESQSLTIADHMYTVLHSQSIKVDLEYYENSQFFDTLRRAQQEGPYRPAHIVDSLTSLFQSAVSLIAVSGLLISFHWSIALILFAAVVPGILVRLKYSEQMYHLYRQQTQQERKASYFNWILTGSDSAKELRMFHLGHLFKDKFQRLRSTLRRDKIAISRRRSVADLIAQITAILPVFGSLSFIVYRTIHGAITIGDMVMYFQAFQRGLGFLNELLGSFAKIYEDNLFLHNLFEFLNLKPKVQEPVHPVPVPKPIRNGIHFHHVHFRYPGSHRNVLDDVSFSIHPGEVVALVGENGCGKTTLVKLLCRLYDPLNGSITVDDIDLKQFSINSIRSEISVIFQDYVHYHMTARENIWLGNIALDPNHANIQRAADQAGAHKQIEQLPRGYETTLGKWFDNGEELSVGEWQKIALARAFFRDTQMIVLDEPTNAMDAKSEYDVFQKFRNLLKGHTAILISHRFSTVRMADRIIVLEKGKLLEQGSHEELIKNKGKYENLFAKQAYWYK